MLEEGLQNLKLIIFLNNDIFFLDNVEFKEGQSEYDDVVEQLNLIREKANLKLKAKVKVKWRINYEIIKQTFRYIRSN